MGFYPASRAFCVETIRFDVNPKFSTCREKLFFFSLAVCQNTSINQAIRDELLENIKNMLHKNE